MAFFNFVFSDSQRNNDKMTISPAMQSPAAMLFAMHTTSTKEQGCQYFSAVSPSVSLFDALRVYCLLEATSPCLRLQNCALILYSPLKTLLSKKIHWQQSVANPDTFWHELKNEPVTAHVLQYKSTSTIVYKLPLGTYTTLNFNAELFDLEQTMHFNQREGHAPNRAVSQL